MEIELARSWKDPQSSGHLVENPVAAAEVGGLDRYVAAGTEGMLTYGCCSCSCTCDKD